MSSGDNNVPSIPEFFKDKSVFITGFTGFLGQVLVEKLLRSCPDVKQILVLIREKKGMKLEERLDSILKNDLFDKVRQIMNTKIVCIGGDIMLPGFAISDEDRATLNEEVHFFYHGAASVRFDDPITFAIDINIKATKEAADLAASMRNLKSFSYISTAYAICDRRHIKEILYPPHVDWKDILRIRERIDESTLNILSEKYMNGMPNTYVFTKSIAEHIINDYGETIPSSILRPSIVVSPKDEPIPGWIINFNGPTGLLAGYGLGVVRTCLCNREVSPDYVPADTAIKAVITATWADCITKKPGETRVVNISSQDKTTNGLLMELGKEMEEHFPMIYNIWRPTNHTSTTKLSYMINFYLYQLIPAFFVDIALRIIGRKPMLWRIQRKIFVAMMSLTYFSMNSFNIEHDYLTSIQNKILPQDFDSFHYDVVISKEEKFLMFSKGCLYFQKAYFNQTPEHLGKAKRFQKTMRIVDFIVKKGFYISVIWLLYSYDALGIVNSFLNWIVNV